MRILLLNPNTSKDITDLLLSAGRYVADRALAPVKQVLLEGSRELAGGPQAGDTFG